MSTSSVVEIVVPREETSPLFSSFNYVQTVGLQREYWEYCLQWGFSENVHLLLHGKISFHLGLDFEVPIIGSDLKWLSDKATFIL